MPFEDKREDVIRLGKTFNFRKNPTPFLIGLGIVVLLIISNIFYTIEPNELGVLLRFGKYIKSTEPGLHMKIPFGIDKVYPVKVDYIYKEEFGFRTQHAGVRTRYSRRSYDDESIMLSGDLNVVDLEWIIQYKIKDPVAFLFDIRNVRKTLRDISESVVRKIVGNYSFTEVLTTKRIEINNLAQVNMEKILDSYGIGVDIVTVKLQDVNPPKPVQPAFNEVNEAKQQKEKLINQAWEIYNRKIPEARGKAEQMIEEAEGYKLEVINNARGDSDRFLLRLSEYKKAPKVTRERLYLEKMQSILQKAGKKYIVNPRQQNILPLLKLNNEQD
jgi:membrane protease subunit HflK